MDSSSAAAAARRAPRGSSAMRTLLVASGVSALAATGLAAMGFTSPLASRGFGRSERVRMMAEGRQADSFVDKAFGFVANVLVSGMEMSQEEKDAYQYYRDGMSAQTSGDYATALRAYAEALKLEEDPLDRSFIFYNLGIIFGNNGEYIKAVKYYHLALDQNKGLQQAYNNIAVVYHNQAMRAERKGNMEKAAILYDKAGLYWNQAIRLAPSSYFEAQNWLKETGRMAVI